MSLPAWARTPCHGHGRQQSGCRPAGRPSCTTRTAWKAPAGRAGRSTAPRTLVSGLRSGTLAVGGLSFRHGPGRSSGDGSLKQPKDFRPQSRAYADYPSQACCADHDSASNGSLPGWSVSVPTRLHSIHPAELPVVLQMTVAVEKGDHVDALCTYPEPSFRRKFLSS